MIALTTDEIAKVWMRREANQFEFARDIVAAVNEKLNNELERKSEEIEGLIEANNNLRSHRDEALTDAKEFCLQVSKLTEKLEQITSDITALRAVAKEMADRWMPKVAIVGGYEEEQAYLRTLAHWKELEK